MEEISYNQVEEYCREMHTVAMQIKRILSLINDKYNEINSCWKGEAADYYLKKFKETSQKFENVYLELENCILFMANCSDEYKKIDDDIMKEICNNLGLDKPNLSNSKIFR